MEDKVKDNYIRRENGDFIFNAIIQKVTNKIFWEVFIPHLVGISIKIVILNFILLRIYSSTFYFYVLGKVLLELLWVCSCCHLIRVKEVTVSNY